MVILSGNFRWYIDNEEGEGFFSIEKDNKPLKISISELYKINPNDIFLITHIKEVDLNNSYYLMCTDEQYYVNNPKIIKSKYFLFILKINSIVILNILNIFLNIIILYYQVKLFLF